MTLDTGLFCAVCQIHRVVIEGGKCPSCLDDQRKAKEKTP
jgi:hypothetical protein